MSLLHSSLYLWIKSRRTKNFFIRMNAYSKICMWRCPLMISPWVSYIFSTWLYLSYIQTGGLRTIQTFWVMSLYTYVKATPSLFLHYFCSWPHKKARWVSLIRILSHPLLCTFTSSYKIFKTSYFKVTIRLTTGNNFFFDSARKPLFPFYWQQCYHQYDEYSKKYLIDEEL